MTEREHELSKDCWCEPIVEYVPALDDTQEIPAICGDCALQETCCRGCQ